MNPASRPSAGAQRRWLLVLTLGVLAPLVLHLGVLAQHPRLVALWWPAIALCALGAVLLRRLSWPLLAAFLACVGIAWWSYTTGNPAVVFTPAPVINLALMWYFGRSLRGQREPVITRIARIERARTELAFPDEMRRYTRTLTLVWCCFFMVNGAVAVLLALVAPLRTWSWYTNVLNLPLVVLMFGGEYLVRRWRFPQYPHTTPWQLALHIASSPREYLGGAG